MLRQLAKMMFPRLHCTSDPQKVECPIVIQVCGLRQPHSWMVSCPTVLSDDKPVSSGNQCTYIDTMTS